MVVLANVMLQRASRLVTIKATYVVQSGLEDSAAAYDNAGLQTPAYMDMDSDAEEEI